MCLCYSAQAYKSYRVFALERSIKKLGYRFENKRDNVIYVDAHKKKRQHKVIDSLVHNN